MNVYGVMAEWHWQCKTEVLRQKDLSLCHFVHHKFFTWTGQLPNPGLRGERQAIAAWAMTERALLDKTPCTLLINPRISWDRPDKKLYEGHIRSQLAQSSGNLPASDWIMWTEFYCLSCWVSVRDCVTEQYRLWCGCANVCVRVMVGLQCIKLGIPVLVSEKNKHC